MMQVLRRKSFNHGKNFIKNVFGSQTWAQRHLEQQQQTLDMQGRNVSRATDLDSWNLKYAFIHLDGWKLALFKQNS